MLLSHKTKSQHWFFYCSQQDSDFCLHFMGSWLIKFLGKSWKQHFYFSFFFFHWIKTRIKIPVGAGESLVKDLSPPQLGEFLGGDTSSTALLLQPPVLLSTCSRGFFSHKILRFGHLEVNLSPILCYFVHLKDRMKSQDRSESGLKHLCPDLIGIKQCSALAPISLSWIFWFSVWDRGSVSVSEREEMDSSWAGKGLD